MATALVCLPQTMHSASEPAPKLVVLIVVDQMRADYVDRFHDDWTGGLKRMVTEGAWFRRAAYPYLTTVTCAGHATISAGAFPRTHGIIQNAWWDRDSRRSVTCTNDVDARATTYGPLVTRADSPYRLSVPTFADVMRTERGAHVVTLSLKARSAIMLAGRGADAALWLSDNLEGWVSSSVYGGSPVAAVKAFVEANPIDADYGKSWDRLLPASRYHEPDAGDGEVPPPGWTSVFPHVLASSSQHPDASFRRLWEESPYADAYLGRFAGSLVESLHLGTHESSDVLAISFSSTDIVGHGFGPDSQEVEDMYAHLDQTIGALLNRLDQLVGPGNYVVALTADHGVTSIPEQRNHAGKDGGRLDGAAIARVIEDRARASLGPGKYVAAIASNDIYFQPGVYDKLMAMPSAMDAILKAVRNAPGIAAAFSSDQVRAGMSSKDRLLRAAALSYFPGRSGDLILVPKPGWMAAGGGTTHGTASDDDQRVPVLFFGAGIRPGKYTDTATPADVTPTLAEICGVNMPQADGHPLKDALKSTPRDAVQ